MSEIKLLPCPFCGGENIKVLGSETSYYWCRCMNCLASTTTEDVEEDAIKAWNTRQVGVCIWKYDESFEYATSECGSMDTHRIDFRSLHYCPYCSKKIEIKTRK